MEKVRNDVRNFDVPDMTGERVPQDPHKGEYGTSDRQDRAARQQEFEGVGLFDDRTPDERFGGKEPTKTVNGEKALDAAVHPFERP